MQPPGFWCEQGLADLHNVSMKRSTMPLVIPAVLAAASGAQGDAAQRVVKVRRDYNAWVAREAMEIFLAGLPISVYADRHGLDMDLLTRDAGFGYDGSTITSCSTR